MGINSMENGAEFMTRERSNSQKSTIFGHTIVSKTIAVR